MRFQHELLSKWMKPVKFVQIATIFNIFSLVNRLQIEAICDYLYQIITLSHFWWNSNKISICRTKNLRLKENPFIFGSLSKKTHEANYIIKCVITAIVRSWKSKSESSKHEVKMMCMFGKRAHRNIVLINSHTHTLGRSCAGSVLSMSVTIKNVVETKRWFFFENEHVI